MKKTIPMLVAMLFASAMISAAQSSLTENVSETRASKPYYFIHIQGELDVKVVQDERAGVRVEGTRYQLSNTMTILKNDTLFVYQTNTRKGDSKTRLVISVTELVALEVSGKSNVDCSGLINADYLTVRAKDGAQIKLDVRALKVDTKAVGSSFISVSGNAVVHASMTDHLGKIDAHGLEVLLPEESESTICARC